MYEDYHIHTEFSDDSREPMENQIERAIGLEFGIQTDTIPQYEKLWERYEKQLDFALLSMHQVDNKEFWNQEFQNGKTQKEYNLAYYQEILKVMRQFKHYSVLAHLDLIIRYDKNGVFPFKEVRDIIAEILKTAIEDGKGIEINTSSWHYGLSDTQRFGVHK